VCFAGYMATQTELAVQFKSHETQLNTPQYTGQTGAARTVLAYRVDPPRVYVLGCLSLICIDLALANTTD